MKHSIQYNDCILWRNTHDQYKIIHKYFLSKHFKATSVLNDLQNTIILHCNGIIEQET